MKSDEVREGLQRGLAMLEDMTNKDDENTKKLMHDLAVSLETTILTSLIQADKYHTTIRFLEVLAQTRYQQDMLALLENAIVFGLGMAGHLNMNGQEAIEQFMRMLKAKEGKDGE